MAAEHLITIGSLDQLSTEISGDYFHGLPHPRVVMVGRSNVGKSSLLNALTQSSLAQISKKPGKTRKIHAYFWKEAGVILVDLPGYGFANASKADQAEWTTFVNGYLEADPGLKTALILLDARHGPTPADREAIKFLEFRSIHPMFVMTKWDTLKKQSEQVKRKRQVKADLTTLLEEHGLDFEEGVFWVHTKRGAGWMHLERALKALKG